MNDFDDIEIAEKAKNDTKEFEVLYEYYFPKIFAYCLNRVANYADAEDITSKVFLSALESIQSFDPTRRIKFGSWLYRIAHNKIIDHYRSNKSAKHTDITEVEEIYIEEYDRRIEINEKQKQIALVMVELPERYQEVISLKFYAELTNPEIAEIWDEKPSVVALVLHRALKAFKTAYSKKFPDSEIT